MSNGMPPAPPAGPTPQQSVAVSEENRKGDKKAKKGSADKDLKILMEADAIRNDPARMEAASQAAIDGQREIAGVLGIKSLDFPSMSEGGKAKEAEGGYPVHQNNLQNINNTMGNFRMGDPLNKAPSGNESGSTVAPNNVNNAGGQ